MNDLNKCSFMHFNEQCHLTVYAQACQDQQHTMLCHFSGLLTPLSLYPHVHNVSHENYRIQNYTPPVTDVNMYNIYAHVQHMQHIQNYYSVLRYCISIITLCTCEYGQGWTMRMCGSIGMNSIRETGRERGGGHTSLFAHQCSEPEMRYISCVYFNARQQI